MTENTITLDEGEVKQVAVPQIEDKDSYRVNVKQGQVRFGDTKADTYVGSEGIPGDRGRITPEGKDTIWVRNTGIGQAKVELVPQGLEIDWYPNQKVNVTSKVFPGVEADSHTASVNNDTFTFKDQIVPEGAEVYIYPDSANSGKGLVNGEAPIGGGQSYAVSNMNAVEIEATQSGDTFYAVTEVDQ